MFFLANSHNKTHYNHPGLLILNQILNSPIHRSTLAKFINESFEKTLILSQTNFRKSYGILRIYQPTLNWSIDILHQEQVLLLCQQLDNFKNTPYILTFDGFEFKLQNYNQAYLNDLIRLYLNRDIYIGIATNIDMSCYIYSSNAPGLEILVDLVRYACVILMRWNDIEDALNQRSQFHTFTFDNESGVKIIDKNHLLVFSYDYDTTYKISKTIFLDLIQTYNNHHHSSRDIFCAKTVLILDDQSAQLDLID